MSVEDKTKRIQINLDLSPELYQTISDLAQQMNQENAEVLLKAIALLEVVVEAKRKGKYIWITDENQNLETEIIGI
ncbi:DNA-binding protein [Nostoc sp. PA-18-2419]|uniref:DNA-binding protein n=1 Tax=Nostoc sp. PA-18-2419 TaxID=2575443 RepID=UPI001107BAB2|nr:DNA-binding protein [Nostoc sp. PA-18-2419]